MKTTESQKECSIITNHPNSKKWHQNKQIHSKLAQGKNNSST